MKLLILSYLLNIFILFMSLSKLINSLSLSIARSNVLNRNIKNFITKNSKLVMTTDTYDVLTMIKRTETYYTQGIFFDRDGNLIESGGLYKQSVLVKMEYPSLRVIKKIKLSKKYFGEGVAKCGDKIYQLTWNERKILRYSYPDMEILSGDIEMDPQIKSGWGLASISDENLIATDGTNNIYVLDCLNNLNVILTIPVTYNNQPLDQLNAIVVVDGFIYANRYYDSHIYKINPLTKSVIKVYDFDCLVKNEIKNKSLTHYNYLIGDVLNGIAYDGKRKIFVITGKRWGYYYEVNLK